MKRTLFALVIVLAAALGLGTLLLNDGGYVLVYFAGWELETSFVFALLVLLAATAVLSFALLVLGPFAQLLAPSFWEQRRQDNAHTSLLRSGTSALVKGQWEKASQRFNRATKHSQWPTPAMLGAAIAERKRGNMAAHYAWLEKASAQTHGETLTLLSHGFFALLDDTPLKAKALLEVERKKHSKNPWFLALLAEAYYQDEDWYAYTEIVPQLLSFDTGWQVEERAQVAWGERLRAAAKAQHQDQDDVLRQVRAQWQHMPKTLQEDSQLLIQYSGYLVQLGAGREAFNLVRQAMQQQWREALLPALVAIEAEQVAVTERLALLESWLKDRPGNNDVLLCLARVAMLEPDYLDSAEEWLRQCEPEPRVWRALAECHQRQGLQEQANQALWQWHNSQQAATTLNPVARNQTRPNEVAQG